MKYIIIIAFIILMPSCSVIHQPKVICALGDLTAACLNKATKYIKK